MKLVSQIPVRVLFVDRDHRETRPGLAMFTPLLKAIGLSAVLALLGAIAFVAFRSHFGEEEYYLLFLFALAIGTGVGLVADFRKGFVLSVAIAAVAAWVCGLTGVTVIALLEQDAVTAEFNLQDLSHPDFFIALEAYRISETEKPTGRAFTDAAKRECYDDETWRAATAAWNAKPDLEKDAIRRDWQSGYTDLNTSSAARVRESFFSPSYLLVYAISTMISAGVVVAFAWEARRSESS